MVYRQPGHEVERLRCFFVRTPASWECVSFDTAWTPPQPVIEKLFELFPAVRFELEYFECGVAFCGGLSYDPEDDETRSWSGEYSGSRGG